MAYPKWVQIVINQQEADGSWGSFHSLAKGQPTTTEQALRRLRALGLSKDDEPIALALSYMRSCLSGELRPPDRREKVLNWDAFEAHMLASWIRIFDPDDVQALAVADFWATIVKAAFSSGAFNTGRYHTEYRKHIPMLNPGEQLIKLTQFYMVNLLKGRLDPKTENSFLDHIINYPTGIYYINSRAITKTPQVFASRETSYYLAALEQLVGYEGAPHKLCFAVDWIRSHQDANDQWDLGAKSNDGIYFPLSDSWRKEADRRKDCTFRINNLLRKLSVES